MLVEIMNAEEDQIIHNYLTMIETLTNYIYWIGIEESKLPRWASTGRIVDYTNWDDGEPVKPLSDVKTLYCAYLTLPNGEESERKWSISPCSDNDAYALCQRGMFKNKY